MQIVLIYNHITCNRSFCNVNLFFPSLPKVQLRIKSQAPQPVPWQRKQWQGWTCRPKSPVQGEVTKSYATDLISSMTSWIWIPWLKKMLSAIFGCMSSVWESTLSNCYDILSSSRFFNFTYIWCYQSSMQLSHSGGFISKNCKTSFKKLKSSMACRIFRKSKTTLWVWFFPESSRVRISPSFPTIAAYPVDLPNAGVALSNLTIFQMRCCQHREMFKIGKKILETWNICAIVWI